MLFFVLHVIIPIITAVIIVAIISHYRNESLCDDLRAALRRGDLRIPIRLQRKWRVIHRNVERDIAGLEQLGEDYYDHDPMSLLIRLKTNELKAIDLYNRSRFGLNDAENIEWVECSKRIKPLQQQLFSELSSCKISRKQLVEQNEAAGKFRSCIRRVLLSFDAY